MKTKYKRCELNPGYNLCNGYIITTVSSDRSKVACFHIIDDQTLGINFNCRIAFEECRYLKGDILTENLKTSVMKFFKSKVPKMTFPSKIVKTQWQFMIGEWNGGNKKKLDFAIKLPDYNQLVTKE